MASNLTNPLTPVKPGPRTSPKSSAARILSQGQTNKSTAQPKPLPSRVLAGSFRNKRTNHNHSPKLSAARLSQRPSKEQTNKSPAQPKPLPSRVLAASFKEEANQSPPQPKSSAARLLQRLSKEQTNESPAQPKPLPSNLLAGSSKEETNQSPAQPKPLPSHLLTGSSKQQTNKSPAPRTLSTPHRRPRETSKSPALSKPQEPPMLLTPLKRQPPSKPSAPPREQVPPNSPKFLLVPMVPAQPNVSLLPKPELPPKPPAQPKELLPSKPLAPPKELLPSDPPTPQKTRLRRGHKMAAEIQALYVKRHDEAVRRIHETIRTGDCGNSTILMDAGKQENELLVDLRRLLKIAPKNMLKLELNNVSNPDLIILPGVSKARIDHMLSTGGRLPLCQRIILIEVGYTDNARTGGKRNEKWEQHCELANTLTRLGFQVVFQRDVHCIPLGSRGAVCKSLAALLRMLGVTKHEASKLMQCLKKHAILYADAISSVRQRYWLSKANKQLRQLRKRGSAWHIGETG